MRLYFILYTSSGERHICHTHIHRHQIYLVLERKKQKNKTQSKQPTRKIRQKNRELTV